MKIIFAISLLVFFNGCLQNGVFLGPAITVASSGNMYQAGLSFGSSQVVTNITGKTPLENIKVMMEPKKNENKIVRSAKKKINYQLLKKDLAK